jgi:hypothetical protein
MVEVPLGTSICKVQLLRLHPPGKHPLDALVECALSRHTWLPWAHLMGAWNFVRNTIRNWMDSGQVMKGVMAPLGKFKVGNVGTWVHLRVKGLASARQVSYKSRIPQM